MYVLLIKDKRKIERVVCEYIMSFSVYFRTFFEEKQKMEMEMKERK